MNLALTEELPMTATSAGDLPDGLFSGVSSMCLAGLALVQPECSATDYSPRWYRAWEQELYARLVRKHRRTGWAMQRFAGDALEPPGKSAYREVIGAVASAARQALADADKRCGRRAARERMALLYSDFWGRGSHMEQAFNWRDAFDLDVLPKSLLRDHAIDGYSCKLQAGRASVPQGLLLAADLLYGGDIDSVMLGGLFRFYPALGFSEALQNHGDERRWLGRGGRHQGRVVERAGFVVLRRAEALASLRQDSLLIDTPQYLQLPKGRKAAGLALQSAWNELAPQGAVLGGHYPSSLLEAVEAAGAGSGRACSSTVAQFGDSGGLNPLLALQQLLAGDQARSEPSLLSLSDATGGTWLVRCRPQKARSDK